MNLVNKIIKESKLLLRESFNSFDPLDAKQIDISNDEDSNVFGVIQQLI